MDVNLHDYITEKLIYQSDTSSDRLSSIVPATNACMRISAVLPMGRSAYTSSSLPSSCSDSNGNNITNITNTTSVENTGLVYEKIILEGAMSLGG